MEQPTGLTHVAVGYAARGFVADVGWTCTSVTNPGSSGETAAKSRRNTSRRSTASHSQVAAAWVGAVSRCPAGRWQNRIVPMLERVRTDQVVVGFFCHEPGEAATSVEWWQEPCIAFTAFGSWQVRSRRGKGEVAPDAVLATEAAAEHDCRHPGGLDDRMLCVLYRSPVDPGPVLLVPQMAALHSLRRSLVAELRPADPDRDEVEALSLALLEAVRQAPGSFAQAGEAVPCGCGPAAGRGRRLLPGSWPGPGGAGAIRLA